MALDSYHESRGSPERQPFLARNLFRASMKAAIALQADIATDLWVLLFDSPEISGSVVCILTSDGHNHIDDRYAWRVPVGLPNVQWPLPAEEHGKLMPQLRGREIHMSTRGLGHYAAGRRHNA